MASVIQQTERYGTGVTRAFRVFSDALRERRQYRAEELARKATVKLMFPTVLCILPAMFIVILAPTVFRALAMLQDLNTTVPISGGPGP
jgi:tight adherence protein C